MRFSSPLVFKDKMKASKTGVEKVHIISGIY